MPDFNKGDFTQQGVNGHVNATVRLNEKRLVNIDLTSNEAAEGCTITGAVKDLLNNKVYAIGSGGGDALPTATITLNNATGGDLYASGFSIPVKDEYGINNSLSFIAGDITTITKEVFYTYHDKMLTYMCAFNYEDENDHACTVAISDMINCTVLGTAIIITNPSLPASATVTLSSGN